MPEMIKMEEKENQEEETEVKEEILVDSEENALILKVPLGQTLLPKEGRKNNDKRRIKKSGLAAFFIKIQIR